jgi:hypothetical protein
MNPTACSRKILTSNSRTQQKVLGDRVGCPLHRLEALLMPPPPRLSLSDGDFTAGMHRRLCFHTTIVQIGLGASQLVEKP